MSAGALRETAPGVVTTWIGGDDVEQPTREDRFWAKVDRNGPIPEYWATCALAHP